MSDNELNISLWIKFNQNLERIKVIQDSPGAFTFAHFKHKVALWLQKSLL